MKRIKLKTYCDKVQNRPETLEQIRWTYNQCSQWEIGDYLDLKCKNGNIESYEVTGSATRDSRSSSEIIKDGYGSFSRRQQRQVPLRWFVTVNYINSKTINKFW
tara:strand:+ start:336 stop:647 length:312 start_codon:yes stop_codon:yes gene_type:complete